MSYYIAFVKRKINLKSFLFGFLQHKQLKIRKQDKLYLLTLSAVLSTGNLSLIFFIKTPDILQYQGFVKR